MEDPTMAVAREKARAFRRRCRGKRVKVYDLPARFNKDFIDKCAELGDRKRCTAYINGGFGPPLAREDSPDFDGQWWATDPLSLEVIFHNRLQNHLCRVEDEADLYYIPFYASLDFEHSSAQPLAPKETFDALAEDLVAWLNKQPNFVRFSGLDHFMAVGRPTWAFRRQDKMNETWGSKLEFIPEFDEVTKLEVERHPWTPGHTVGVPYPTGLHPSRDKELRSWQAKARSGKRQLLWALVLTGSPSLEERRATNEVLVKQCEKAAACGFVNCTEAHSAGCSSRELMELYLQVQFVVHACGGSFTSHAIFESMLGGAVPVFLWQEAAYAQYPWHLPGKREAFSVYVPFQDVLGGLDVEAHLAKLPGGQVAAMQKAVIDRAPQLVYFEPSAWALQGPDAVDVVLEALARKAREAKQEAQPRDVKALLLSAKEGTAEEEDDEFLDDSDSAKDALEDLNSTARLVKIGDGR